MVKFIVRGPIEVPLERGVRGEPHIAEDKLRSLSDTYPDLDRPGCYIFACASGRGSLPIYVGQAKGGIFLEAFNHRNKYNINRYFRKRLRGKLQLYIVPQVHVKDGQGSAGAIADIEEFLIAIASRRNSDLINIHGTRPAKWSIAGVHNHRSGNPGTSVILFKRMMGIATKVRVIDGQEWPEPESPAEQNQIELPSDVVLDDALQPEEAESVDPNSAEATEIDEASRPNLLVRMYYRLLYWLGIRTRAYMDTPS